MGWLVHLDYLDDKPTVDTDDLTLAEWDPVRAASDVPWWTVMAAPVVYPAGAAALVTVCADHLGRARPPDDWLTPKNVLQVFDRASVEVVVPDENTVYDPKLEDGTKSSSGAPDSSDGLQPSPVSNQSVISVS